MVFDTRSHSSAYQISALDTTSAKLIRRTRNEASVTILLFPPSAFESPRYEISCGPTVAAHNLNASTAGHLDYEIELLATLPLDFGSPHTHFFSALCVQVLVSFPVATPRACANSASWPHPSGWGSTFHPLVPFSANACYTPALLVWEHVVMSPSSHSTNKSMTKTLLACEVPRRKDPSATLAELPPSFSYSRMLFPHPPCLSRAKESTVSLLGSLLQRLAACPCFAYLHLHAPSYPNLLTLLRIGAWVDLLKSLHEATADWSIPRGIDGETKLLRQVRVASLPAFSQVV